MKSPFLLHGLLLILFYVFWFCLTSSPEEFHSTGHWFSPQGIGSYLAGYGLVMAWVCSSSRMWQFRFAIAGIFLGLIALLVWWRGTGHSGSILPFLDNGRFAGGFFIGCALAWWRWARSQSEKDPSSP